jgi:hypothetical protein
MPAGSEYFTLEVNGTRVHQPLSERAHVPVSSAAVAPPVSEVLPADESSIPEALPAGEPPLAGAVPAAKGEDDDDLNAEWRNIHLELKKDEETDIDLEKPQDE